MCLLHYYPVTLFIIHCIHHRTEPFPSGIAGRFYLVKIACLAWCHGSCSPAQGSAGSSWMPKLIADFMQHGLGALRKTHKIRLCKKIKSFKWPHLYTWSAPLFTRAEIPQEPEIRRIVVIGNLHIEENNWRVILKISEDLERTNKNIGADCVICT